MSQASLATRSQIRNLLRNKVMLVAVLVLFVAAGTACATVPTVSISVSGPTIGNTYFVGDSFTLTVTGPPNQPVTVSQTRTSLRANTSWQTDANGVWTISGSWSASDMGSYTQTWSVGGVAANPTLSFQIVALPTVSLTVTGQQSGTTYYAGDSFTLTVTGPPNQPVTVSQTRSAVRTNDVWQTNAQGVFSVSGSWSYSDVGTYAQRWYVAGVPASPQLSFSVMSLAPTISGPNNATQAAIWYFNGAPAMDDGYDTSVTLTLRPPSPADPSPTVSWSTDSPEKVSLSPSTDGTTVVVRSLSASALSAGYDIHVTVSYDGTKSTPFPLFVNTPRTMRTSLPGQFCTSSGCDCSALGAAGAIGYATAVKHQIAGIDGVWLQTPISVNESLEKQQWIAPNYQTAYASGVLKNPTASAWAPSDWVTNASGSRFIDIFSVCASPNWPYTPIPSSYSVNGTITLFNETQKFWVGSRTHFRGTCVQRGVVTLYADHGTLTNYTSPIVDNSDCNQGNVIN